MARLAMYLTGCALPDCDVMIRPGDPIVMTDDGAIHDGCPVARDPLAAAHPVCTTCWLTHPEGACDR